MFVYLFDMMNVCLSLVSYLLNLYIYYIGCELSTY